MALIIIENLPEKQRCIKMHITYLEHLVVQENQHLHLDLVAQETLADQRGPGPPGEPADPAAPR